MNNKNQSILTNNKQHRLASLKQVLTILLLCFISLANYAVASVTAKNQFIDMMVEKHQFDKKQLNNVFANTRPNQTILKAIAKPWEAKPWFQYYPLFLTEKRLEKGMTFWLKYEKELAAAEQQTGVPAQIIVAIIGIETFYGSYLGKYSVFDALQTLTFNYPARAAFFGRELEQLFLLAREENFEITSLMGSYAGAMGWGQFIPSSYRAYAVDFDNDGRRDLLNNPIDAIGSVANYFKRHGWQASEAIAYQAKVQGSQFKSLLSSQLKLKHTWQQVQKSGVQVTNKLMADYPAETKVKLVKFELIDQPEYWLVLNNFYVITRYNHSPLYAMVVYQFSEQLLAAKGVATQ